MDTPGQLTPFVLGLCGLIRVLWCKWRLVMRGVKEETLLDSRPADDYEMAMEKYLRWKESEMFETPTSPPPQTVFCTFPPPHLLGNQRRVIVPLILVASMLFLCS